jgi:hypothetical protein
MKRTIVSFLCCVLVVVGCAGRASRNRKDYAGEYIFTPGDPSIPERFSDFVLLKENGSAIQCRYDQSTGKIVMSEAAWTLEETGPGTAIVIAGFRHPVWRIGGSVRLHINSDLNQYYQKVR